MKTNDIKNVKNKLTLEPVYYYKLKNGDELISVEEPIGTYKKSMLVTIKKSTNMPEEEKRSVQKELETELKKELKDQKKTHLELHYPMKVSNFPVSNGQAALYMNFWISPSIHPTQIVNLPKDEILIKLPVDPQVISYYFSLLSKYILTYAKSLLAQGHEFSSTSKNLIETMEEQLNEDTVSEFENIDVKNSKENQVPYVVLGNGLKKTLH